VRSGVRVRRQRVPPPRILRHHQAEIEARVIGGQRSPRRGRPQAPWIALNERVAPSVPTGIDGLTAEWLTEALSESGVLRGERVVAAPAERVGEGYGFTGVVARVELAYEPTRGDLPRSLIAKLPMALDDASSGYRRRQERDPVLARRYYGRCAREERFYREVGARCAPARYYSAADDEHMLVVLLLEDLSNGRQGDVLEGCSVDEAAVVLDEIAAFHARWWGKRAPREGFPLLVRDPGEWQERYERQAETFLERHGDSVPSDVSRIASKLRARLASAAGALYGQPRTLVHGDLHLDNVLFDCRGAGTVAVLDWQTVSFSAPAWDVTLFLVDSLSIEDRRAAEGELLDRYLGRLAEHGVGDYTREELRLECRLSLLLLLAGTLGWLTSLDPSELSGREHTLHARALGDGRLAAALVDHDVEPQLTRMERAP
jgi:Phosphotransferase enzyme family